MRLDYPLPLLGRMLKVSSSGYYGWVDRPLSKRAQEEMRLELEVKEAHRRTRQTYGAERLQREMAEHDMRVGIGRLKRLRRKMGLRCKHKCSGKPSFPNAFCRLHHISLLMDMTFSFGCDLTL